MTVGISLVSRAAARQPDAHTNRRKRRKSNACDGWYYTLSMHEWTESAGRHMKGSPHSWLLRLS
jgi:hypothetical protein